MYYVRYSFLLPLVTYSLTLPRNNPPKHGFHFPGKRQLTLNRMTGIGFPVDALIFPSSARPHAIQAEGRSWHSAGIKNVWRFTSMFLHDFRFNAEELKQITFTICFLYHNWDCKLPTQLPHHAYRAERCGVLTVVKVRTIVLCTLVGGFQHFGGTYWRHLEDKTADFYPQGGDIWSPITLVPTNNATCGMSQNTTIWKSDIDVNYKEKDRTSALQTSAVWRQGSRVTNHPRLMNSFLKNIWEAGRYKLVTHCVHFNSS
jgi:hypothetical protein